MKDAGSKSGPSRHAYLVMAYDNLEIVTRLLEMIDDPRNDVFIHIDRSVRNFDPGPLQKVSRQSRIVFVPRVKVHWGHFSQIQSVFNLLEEATRSHHSYYHLLSGSDLPIKSQAYIHAFFARHEGKEFVGFSGDDFLERVKLYQFFNAYRRPSTSVQAVARYLLRFASSLSLGVQRRAGIDRSRNFGVEVRKGSDWFSITHNLALHVLEKRRWIRKLFRFAEIPTEFYVQTLVWNSPFRDQVFDPTDEFVSSMRLVDWSRGDPYVFRKADLAQLLESERLFARKFLASVDLEVVKELSDRVLR